MNSVVSKLFIPLRCDHIENVLYMVNNTKNLFAKQEAMGNFPEFPVSWVQETTIEENSVVK